MELNIAEEVEFVVYYEPTELGNHTARINIFTVGNKAQHEIVSCSIELMLLYLIL